MMDFLDDYPTVVAKHNDQILNASEAPKIRHEYEICFKYEVHKLAALCIAWVGWFITLLGMLICHYRRRRAMEDESDDLCHLCGCRSEVSYSMTHTVYESYQTSHQNYIGIT